MKSNKKHSEQVDNKQTSNHVEKLNKVIDKILNDLNSGLSMEDKIKFMDIPLPQKKNS
jgi:flagellin-specific chaperone FliS